MITHAFLLRRLNEIMHRKPLELFPRISILWCSMWLLLLFLTPFLHSEKFHWTLPFTEWRWYQKVGWHWISLALVGMLCILNLIRRQRESSPCFPSSSRWDPICGDSGRRTEVPLGGWLEIQQMHIKGLSEGCGLRRKGEERMVFRIA